MVETAALARRHDALPARHIQPALDVAIHPGDGVLNEPQRFRQVVVERLCHDGPLKRLQGGGK